MQKLVVSLVAVAAALAMFLSASPATAFAKTAPTPKATAKDQAHKKQTHKAPKHKATPKPKATPKAQVVTFTVSGTDAGDGIDITYGSDSSNIQGPSSVSTTWTTTLPVDKSAEFYDVTAQLQGDGNITCSVSVGGVTKKGQAVGGYNICQAEVVGFGGFWSAG